MRESLQAGEREALLEEVRSYLPAFLHRGATEQQDPAGDVRELLNLEQEDLDRVVAVHLCLDPAVLAFGDGMENGLKRPFAGSAPAAAVSQAVRGQIDWPGTLRHRARVPGDSARYLVREPGKTFDTAENRALVWLLGTLEKSVDEAIAWNRRTGSGWSGKIDTLRDRLAAARRVRWLRGLPASKPTAAVLRSLRSTRRGFFAERVPAAIEAVLRLGRPSPEILTAALAERYFQPDDDGTLFQVAVALRLAKAFEALCPNPRRTRLLMGDGRSSFARFAFDDGSEVSLAYQAWPGNQETMRRSFAKRHKMGRSPRRSIPDLIVLRQGSTEDAVIIELKASSNAEYLRNGLQELLGYLADRPDLWGVQPAGWLVAPASEAFEDAGADSSFPIWILDDAAVATAATDRFVPS